MASSTRMITLRSSDGQSFIVEQTVVMQFGIIKELIDDIPLADVTSNVLGKVIQYCQKHADDGVSKEDLELWDAEFVRVDWATLYDIILAAKSLKISSLLDLTCKAVAGMINGKSVEEIRRTFNIQNDYSEEEEEEFRRVNPWAFE